MLPFEIVSQDVLSDGRKAIKITLLLRGKGEDWVEHYADIMISEHDQANCTADEIGARYVAPLLNALASQIIRHKEPVV